MDPTPEYAPTEPFKVKPNPGATRGHVEIRLGRKLIVCKGCKEKRPKGGWSKPCAHDSRVFMGG